MDKQGTSDPEMATAAPRRTLQIFRGKDAPTLDEHGCMSYSIPEDAAPRLAELAELGMNDGAELSVLYSAPGFSLAYAWFKPGYMLPLHAHNSDCLYYVIAGQLHMGTETLGAGDGFFLPAEAWYSYTAGPEGVEILEFRHEEHFDFKVRSGVPKLWERLAESCMKSRDGWKDAVRPVRRMPVEG